MTRSSERFLRKCLWLSSVVFLVLAAVLAYRLFFEPTYEPEAGLNANAVPVDAPAPVSEPNKINPKLAKLLAARMSQTIVRPAPPAVVAAPKPAALPLTSLVKVKGITDYGNPKLNEAVIETVRVGETGFYKAGESVRGVDVIVLQVGSDVLFRYDGRETRLKVTGDESAEVLPVAEPAGVGTDSRLTASNKQIRTIP